MKKIRSHKKIIITGVEIPIEKIAALNDEERWAYYLLGFIANEMNSILKLLVLSLNSNGSEQRFRHMPELINSSILFRMAAGKSFEAMLQLRTREFRTVFSHVISKHLPNANNRWKEVNQAFNSATWLGRMRNGVIFHYPTLAEWKEITTPDDSWEPDEFYFSDGAADVYFDASEIVGQNWVLMVVGGGSPPKTKMEAQVRYEKLIKDTVDLVGLLKAFAMDSLAVFIADHLFGGTPSVKTMGTVRGTNIEAASIPTWVFRE